MVIFVDREDGGGGSSSDLNGEDANLSVTGTIYAPTASFRFNGSETDVLSAQTICYDFVVNGSGSAFVIDYNPDDLFHLWVSGWSSEPTSRVTIAGRSRYGWEMARTR